MEPGIVEEVAGFETFPELEAAAVLFGDDLAGVGFADEWGVRVALGEVPFADEGCVVAAVVEVVGKGAAACRERVVVVADAVFGGGDSGEDGCAGEGAEGMRGDDLGEAAACRGEGVEVGRADVGVAGVGKCLGAELGGEDEKDVGRGHFLLRGWRGGDVFGSSG